MASTRNEGSTEKIKAAGEGPSQDKFTAPTISARIPMFDPATSTRWSMTEGVSKLLHGLSFFNKSNQD